MDCCSHDGSAAADRVDADFGVVCSGDSEANDGGSPSWDSAWSSQPAGLISASRLSSATLSCGSASATNVPGLNELKNSIHGCAG